jgi:hypothetical protein
MKRFFPFVALLAVVAMVGCSGDSPTAKPVPTVVPSAWSVTSLTVSDTDVSLGSPIQVDVTVTQNGSAPPDGTTIEMSSGGPPGAENFGYISGAPSKSAEKLRPTASVVTQSDRATVYFVADYKDPSSNEHADDPVGTYVLQAKANNAVKQVSVNYRASAASGTLQIFSVDPNRGSYAGGQQVVLAGKGIVAPLIFPSPQVTLAISLQGSLPKGCCRSGRFVIWCLPQTQMTSSHALSIKVIIR